MSTDERIVDSPCQGCCRDTAHSVLAAHTEYGGDPNYRESTEHQIIKCRGCGTVSFRRVHSDDECAYPTGPNDDDWETPQTVTTYPPSLANHRGLAGADHLPKIVATIYRETVSSLAQGSTILAGLGLRATLEAVCNEEGITGRDLADRIDRLADSGMISTGDAARLHAIRFIGNDAAHDIKAVPQSAIGVALKIVEHLLESAYILDRLSQGTIEPTLSTLAELETVLKEVLEGHRGSEVPLSVLLGKRTRRFRRKLAALEAEMLAAINSGRLQIISVGKIDVHPDCNGAVQHYIVP